MNLPARFRRLGPSHQCRAAAAVDGRRERRSLRRRPRLCNRFHFIELRWKSSLLRAAMNTRTTMRKELLVGFICVLSALLMPGCASSSALAKAAAQTPYGQLLQDAATYVGGLKDQDKLPGFHKGEHGSLTSIPEPVWEKGISFPVSVVMRGTKEGAESFYRYTIMKPDSRAPWQLVEATRWDKSGHVIEQLLSK